MKWLLRISNSHKTLSALELSSILPDNHFTWLNPLIAIVDANKQEIDKLLDLSFSVRFVISSPTIVESDDTDVIKLINSLKDTIENPRCNSSFAVRAFHVLDRPEKVISTQIEREMGSIILQNYNHLSVNLENPDDIYYVITWRGGLAVGWLYQIVEYSQIGKRAPKESPFFGGGAMKPLLCRVLVNLLYPHQATILDPFCGQGGILREIADLGKYAIGLEISTRVIRECKINNKHHGYSSSIALVQGDALNPPFRSNSILQVVSDPPYAIQTTTKGLDPVNLIERWFKVQPIGMEAIITMPSTMRVDLPTNWIEEFAHEDFVHKSLIRVARKIKRVL